MGLLRATQKIMELIYNEGLKEWLDESKYMDALEELYNRLENGEIDEAEYEENETNILEQLKEVRNYKKENDINI